MPNLINLFQNLDRPRLGGLKIAREASNFPGNLAPSRVVTGQGKILDTLCVEFVVIQSLLPCLLVTCHYRPRRSSRAVIEGLGTQVQ